MSTIEQALYERMTAVAGITALAKARIFPASAPQDITKPFIVFTRISCVRVKHSLGPGYVAQPRFQIDCYATTPAAVQALAGQVRLALDGWQDLSAAVAVKGCSLISDRESWESGTDPKLYRISMDFLLTHNEATS